MMTLKALNEEARELFIKETLEAVRRWVKAQEAGDEEKGEMENEGKAV